MRFDYIVPLTARGFVRAQMELGHRSYPLWVSIASILTMIAILIGVSLCIGGIIFVGLQLVGIDIKTRIPMIAGFIFGYIIYMKFVGPKFGAFFTRFANFSTNLNITSRYSIDEKAIVVDSGDKYVRMNWSAIGGVFQTPAFVVFHCQGLNYFIPKNVIGDKATQNALFEQCKFW